MQILLSSPVQPWGPPPQLGGMFTQLKAEGGARRGDDPDRFMVYLDTCPYGPFHKVTDSAHGLALLRISVRDSSAAARCHMQIKVSPLCDDLSGEQDHINVRTFFPMH